MPERPKLWVLCGGGRKNPHIVSDLRNGAAAHGAEGMLAEGRDFKDIKHYRRRKRWLG